MDGKSLGGQLAHLEKGEPSSLPAAQEMASEPLFRAPTHTWRVLLTSLLHPFLRLRRQEGALLFPRQLPDHCSPDSVRSTGPLGLTLFYSPVSPAPPHTPQSSCCLLASLPCSVETLWLHLCSPHCLSSCHNPIPLQHLPG